MFFGAKRNNLWAVATPQRLVRIVHMQEKTQTCLFISGNNLNNKRICQGEDKSSHKLRIVKSNLAHVHALSLPEVEPWCVHDIQVIEFVTFTNTPLEHSASASLLLFLMEMIKTLKFSFRLETLQ